VFSIGAEDYMQKPFDPALLRARVSALRGKKRLRDQEIRQQQDLNELNKASKYRSIEPDRSPGTIAKELELLNRAKSKALDHLSHELKTLSP